MTTASRLSRLTAAFILLSTAAFAQPPASPNQAPAPAAPSDEATRPATTTFFGDTGIWYVPTGEVLGDGKWSASVYRRGTNWIQGYTNVADFAGTFAYGIKDRAEVFGSFLVDTRIDRDLRPIFVNDPAFGGIIDRYPQANKYWSGDNLGDLYLGVKFNLWSEYRQNPAAIAARAIVKVPTGKADAGVSTGKPDVAFDFIVSKEASKLVEVSGFGGYEFRGSPDGIDAPTGAFRWGTGVAFPSRNMLRISGELNGLIPSKDVATITGTSIVGTDLTRAPVTSATENITRATLGLTFQAKNGFFAGAGVSWNVPTRARSGSFTDEPDVIGDYYDMQFRIGYHPGVRVYAPPPPMREAPPGTIPATQNRPPTVRARCEPCTVEVGKTSTVTGDAQDPDGDTLTYRWSAPTGRFANAGDRQTVWTAPMQEGAVPATIVVDDGKGGTASDSVTIQVIRSTPVVELRFEDVYFDFDRSTLRPEALRLLDDAVARLQANPDKNIIIEGHTCNIGTAEYNLALGDRRANSVKQYLMSRGVPAGRLETRSYGEEAPKFDNTREETRRLNRRAALVVKVQ
ncbi:MAG TPA: OmpA family protein [Vicinamibacterales bacterium]|nr:OmpA family protein [Vicinamibacterales bacterium]